jgi:hypothetical protein
MSYLYEGKLWVSLGWFGMVLGKLWGYWHPVIENFPKSYVRGSPSGF